MQRKPTMNLQPMRLRAALSRTPRGSSSLLRLSSTLPSRLPSGAVVGRWIDSAARAWRADAALA
jgi:hypothetical protein